MPTETAPGASGAKARLKNMDVQEVSTVETAANMRKWIVLKSGTAQKSIDQTEKAMKLPAEAQKVLIDLLSQGLDKLSALASMVGDAEVDDTAAVPEPLLSALKEIGDMLSGAASQFAGAPAEGEPPPAETPAEGAPPPAAEMGKGGVAKKLPAPQKDAPQKSERHDGDDMKQALKKAIEVAGTTLAELAKAGRKIAGSRYKKLTDLHGALGALLNELAFDDDVAEVEAKTKTSKELHPSAEQRANVSAAYDAMYALDCAIREGDSAKIQAGATKVREILDLLTGGSAAPAAEPAAASAETKADDKPKDDEAAKAATPAGDKDEVAKLQKSLADAEAERAKLAKKVEGLERTPGPSNAGVLNDNGGSPRGTVTWPDDLSAGVAARKSADKKKQAEAS